MFKVRIAVFSVAAAIALCSCSSLGGGSAGSGESEYSGIQTRSLGSAPETQQIQNESRPLSELNTPDAIAAREAAARNAPAAGKAAAATQPAAAAKPRRIGAAAPAVLAAASPHQQIEGLQKGAKVHLRSGATLRARPNQGSEMVPSSAGAELELGPQIYNASGYWWYATGGKDSGWISQSDISP